MDLMWASLGRETVCPVTYSVAGLGCAWWFTKQSLIKLKSQNLKQLLSGRLEIFNLVLAIMQANSTR
jgi:hypothetical protein